MTRAELIELIRNGENSGVAFKGDDVSATKLASEMVALLNLRGGHILLGVEEDGTVSGLNRDPRKAEEWVMEPARIHIQPATIPYWETVRWDPGRVVGIVSLSEDASDKPYKVKKGSAWVTEVRVGTTTRDATREEEARLYQQSGRIEYGLKPGQGAEATTLDHRRLRDYFEHVPGWGTSGDPESEEWMTQLVNLDLAVRRHRRTAPTVNGVLLFGNNPKRLVPQSGIRAICYAGEEPDYATRADEDLRGPLVPLRDRGGALLEPGLVDQAWDFVRRNTTPTARLEGPRRADRWAYPQSVIRETVTNALVHRDYSIAGTDITLTIFLNRLEISSPGRLPNTVTPQGMKSGMRYARNQTLVNVMRDYGYVDARGMGVRIKIIPGMLEHNGTEPDLIEDEYRFTVRLWK
ncbi:MAG: putative DNA binding domain-containing protein [Gemmatimonadota bacterium]|nr:putative DNA binding domain-containing protein [Gemmatimonadota bacterium]MDE2986040.1 putative DNA binding domain-containing protein [Gemmatimonadota bacterium]